MGPFLYPGGMIRWLALFAFLSLCSATAENHLPQAVPPLRILVTNDDGIDSPGLHALVQAMSSIGQVTVAAPNENRSGSSSSTTLFSGPILVRSVEIEGAVEAWAVSGTATDAAIFGLVEKSGSAGFDLLVSGINRGSNVGDIAHYSGTVGAAFEGAAAGLPAIAVSQSNRAGFGRAASFCAVFAQKLLQEGGPKGLVYSINVPRGNPGVPMAVEVMPMKGRYLSIKGFKAKEVENGLEYRAQLKFDKQGPPASDTASFQQGNITITPLRYDWTAQDMLPTLRSWRFEKQ
jgi:5'/3'-nucleotidase